MDNIGVNRGVDDIILDEKQATLFETETFISHFYCMW